MVPTIPLPRPASRTSADTVSAAAAELRRRGWTAYRVEYDTSLDPDVRLRVVRGTGTSAVELLLPVDPRVPGPWRAVRIASGPDRAVWSGPAETCSPAALVAFLESLLLRPERDLADRYHRLG